MANEVSRLLLLGLLGCGHGGPDPMVAEMSASDVYKSWLTAHGGDPSKAVPKPDCDVGAWTCFFDGKDHRLVGPGGVLDLDGSGDWNAFLRAADAERVGATIERMQSGTMARLLRPTEAMPSRVSEAVWAQVTAPSSKTEASGVTFTAWYGNPPEFAPWQLVITAPSTGTAKVTREAPKSDKSAEMLETLRAGKGTAQKAAADWLGAEREKKAVPGLIDMLGAKWVDGRKAAAKALGNIGDPAAVAPLATAVMAETDAFAAGDELAALARIGTPEARKALELAKADHPNADVRTRAGVELGALK